MCKVAAYVQVSDHERSAGLSVDEQVHCIESFCSSSNHDLIEIYSDVGSARSERDRLLQNSSRGLFDMVVVSKIDRLSLSQRENLCVIREVFLKNNVEFVSINDKINTQKESGHDFLNALDSLIGLDKRYRRNSIMDGRSKRAEEGKWHGGGTDPIGYDYIDGKLTINTAEAAQVRYVYFLYSKGYTMTEISRRMQDFCTKYGGWDYSSTIANVLDNPLYAGTVHFNDVNAAGEHTPIIDKQLDRLVKRRREKSLSFHHQQKDSKHLLSGVLFCGNCGARYFPRKYADGSYRYVCYSRAKTNKRMIKDPACRNIIVEKSVIEKQVIDAVTELRNSPAMVREIIKKRTASVRGSIGAGNVESQKTARQNAYMCNSPAEKLSSEDARANGQHGIFDNGEYSNSFFVEDFNLNLSEFVAAIDSGNIKYCRHLLSLLLERIEIAEGELTFQWALK